MTVETSLSDKALTFWAILESELRAIPVSHWGYFFPCLVACWRYSAIRSPDLFSPLHMEYTPGSGASPATLRVDESRYILTRHFGPVEIEPGPSVVGSGPGFQWFVRTFLQSEPPTLAFDLIEGIMYFVVEALGREALKRPSLSGLAIPRPELTVLESLVRSLEGAPTERVNKIETGGRSK